MNFFKSHKNILIKIFSALLAVTIGILCAFFVSRQSKPVWNEMSYIESNSSLLNEIQSEYTESENQKPQEPEPEVSTPEESKTETTESETSKPVESTQSETKTESTSGPQTAPPTIIKSYSPSKTVNLAAGESFKVTALARASTAVTANFNGKTIMLKKQSNATGEFVEFTGSFTLPDGNKNDLNLGGVTFNAKWKGHTQKCVSASVVCLRDKSFDRPTIVEVVADSAETFNGNTTNDYSDPRLSYLPQGTVDYKVGDTVYDSTSGKYYYKMRFGRRVYVSKPNPPDKADAVVSKTYKGTLPSTNKISIASAEVSGHHTYLTFDTEWKAPFTVSLAPQNYANPVGQDYEVQSATCSYVDIKFCYTKAIGGKLSFSKSNPLFLASKVIPKDDGYVLRIYLKRVGSFYGWNAYYNQKGQLVFKFLNPTKATSGKNAYGTNLKGITIMLDVGHGGRDIGAGGLKPQTMPEAERNLVLSALLKQELEKMGAKVVMTRYGDNAVTADARCTALRNASPDLCIAIHHDSAPTTANHGCGVFCFNAFSHNATSIVYKGIATSGIYTKTYKEWHYFYLARVTSCPVVLVENGFISNPTDFKGISSYKTNVKKAKNIAQSVANYFRTIK